MSIFSERDNNGKTAFDIARESDELPMMNYIDLVQSDPKIGTKVYYILFSYLISSHII
jgi:hypothetical protein